VFTHELWRIRNRTSERSERVRFLIQNNASVNTLQSTFHVVLCLLYKYWDWTPSFNYDKLYLNKCGQTTITERKQLTLTLTITERKYGSHVKKHDTRLLIGRIAFLTCGKSDTRHLIGLHRFAKENLLCGFSVCKSQYVYNKASYAGTLWDWHVIFLPHKHLVKQTVHSFLCVHLDLLEITWKLL